MHTTRVSGKDVCLMEMEFYWLKTDTSSREDSSREKLTASRGWSSTQMDVFTMETFPTRPSTEKERWPIPIKKWSIREISKMASPRVMGTRNSWMESSTEGTSETESSMSRELTFLRMELWSTKGSLWMETLLERVLFSIGIPTVPSKETSLKAKRMAMESSVTAMEHTKVLLLSIF